MRYRSRAINTAWFTADQPFRRARTIDVSSVDDVAECSEYPLGRVTLEIDRHWPRPRPL